MSAFSLSNRSQTGGTKPLSRWGMDSEHGLLRDVLIGAKDFYCWQDGNAMSRRSQRLGRQFDQQLAWQQYDELVAAYREAGVTTHFLAADENLPYQIYARDSSVMTPWGPIIAQLYSPWRRGEWKAVVEFYQHNEIPIYDVVTAGSFEGGDFMVLEPGVILCGTSGQRTSEVGINQVRGWMEAEGWEFHAYHFDPYFLHLDVNLAMLAEKLAVVCTDVVEDHLLEWLKQHQIEIVDISYKELVNLEVNVVALGNERVLLPRTSKALKEKCLALGLTVFDPDISMYTAGGGGVHCMCQALCRDKIS